MEAPTAEIGHRITVLLASKVAAELERTRHRTSLSTTDVVNRAITFYDFLDAEQENRTELMLRRRDGSTYLIEFH